MTDTVLLLPDAEIIARSSDRLNPHLTILIEADPARPGAVRYGVADFGGAPHWRVGDTLHYLAHLHGIPGTWEEPAERRPLEGGTIIFQADDNAHDLASVSWERRRSWDAVRLVPDIYYYQALGYRDFLPDLPDWRDRPARFVWRGSSTGLPGFAAEELDRLPRYRLCRMAAAFGHADAAMTLVIQGRSPEDDGRMTERLRQEELLRPHVAMEEMGASARFIFDIDGNANSWNFMAKLRLGCCVLKVESDWRQWFQDRLEAWRHYVPIRADLSDLHEKMSWCLDHPDHAECIAAEGVAFARAMNFDAEMRRAAMTTFAP